MSLKKFVQKFNGAQEVTVPVDYTHVTADQVDRDQPWASPPIPPGYSPEALPLDYPQPPPATHFEQQYPQQPEAAQNEWQPEVAEAAQNEWQPQQPEHVVFHPASNYWGRYFNRVANGSNFALLFIGLILSSALKSTYIPIIVALGYPVILVLYLHWLISHYATKPVILATMMLVISPIAIIAMDDELLSILLMVFGYLTACFEEDRHFRIVLTMHGGLFAIGLGVIFNTLNV